MSATTVSLKPWKFGPIRYFKKENPDGTHSPGYSFPILQYPHDLVCLVRDPGQIEKEFCETALKDDEYAEYIPTMYTELLKMSSFTKTYTPGHCTRLTKHAFQVRYDVPGEAADQYSCTLSPNEITLFGGRFLISWNAIMYPIDLQLEEEEVAEVAVAATNIADTVGGVAALSLETPQNSAQPTADIIEVDDIESADGEDDSMVLRSGLTDRQARDRRRVEEFRLRATLAAVRAERALERYIEKYGDYDLESSGSDATDYTTDGTEI